MNENPLISNIKTTFYDILIKNISDLNKDKAQAQNYIDNKNFTSPVKLEVFKSNVKIENHEH